MDTKYGLGPTPRLLAAIEQRRPAPMERTFRRGIYLTQYGNAAYVHGPNAKTAYDLDAAERIPMALVTLDWIRKADDTDRMQVASRGRW